MSCESRKISSLRETLSAESIGFSYFARSSLEITRKSGGIMKMRGLLLVLVLLSGAAPNIVMADTHIRTLAASCSACHGPDGNSVSGTPVLAGLERNHFVLQMQSFRNGGRSSTVMHHHAKGLTEPEIEQLADYFAAVKRVTASSPLPLGDL
jgi:cytochrome c553